MDTAISCGSILRQDIVINRADRGVAESQVGHKLVAGQAHIGRPPVAALQESQVCVRGSRIRIVQSCADAPLIEGVPWRDDYILRQYTAAGYSRESRKPWSSRVASQTQVGLQLRRGSEGRQSQRCTRCRRASVGHGSASCNLALTLLSLRASRGGGYILPQYTAAGYSHQPRRPWSGRVASQPKGGRRSGAGHAQVSRGSDAGQAQVRGGVN